MGKYTVNIFAEIEISKTIEAENIHEAQLIAHDLIRTGDYSYNIEIFEPDFIRNKCKEIFKFKKIICNK